MRISIKDCLGLPAFENAQLLACKELKDETVKNMSVMEANSVADIDGDFAESNQMLITGFYSVRNDVKTQCEIVEKLAEKGMVALVLHRVGEIMPFVSDELIECCKKNRVVLIQLDMENKKPLSEIIEEVSHSFFTEEVKTATATV